MNNLPLEIFALNFKFRSNHILEDINLKLEKTDFLGIIGPNGAGKTVLMKLILGLLKPTSGVIKVFGEASSKARGLVSYVPQFATFDYDFPISVRDVVMMGCMAGKSCFSRRAKEDVDKVEYALAKVEMADLASRKIAGLSGGELQRVLLARALVSEPKLLLLDEPTASLDSRIGRNVYEILDEISSNITIVLISHDLGVISSHVRTIACLNRKLHYHNTKEISQDVLAKVYGCPIDLIAHGHSHRVFANHEEDSK